MNIWAIIKLIAGIIANLPFSDKPDEQEVESVVSAAIDNLQSEPSINTVGIPQSDWEELIKLLTPVLLWFLRRSGR